MCLELPKLQTHGEFPHVHFGWCRLASSASLGLHAGTLHAIIKVNSMFACTCWLRSHIISSREHITIHERKKRCRLKILVFEAFSFVFPQHLEKEAG